MSSEKKLLERYAVTRFIVDAVQKTIDNPDKSVADNLSEGDEKSRKISALLVSSGAAISAASLSTISAETALLGGGAIAGMGAGLAGGAIAGLLGGPIVLGGGLLTLLAVWIRKIIKKRQSNKPPRPKKEKKVKGQKAYEEKIALLKTIIEKMQAIIDKLSKENKENKERIRNLEEALRMMQETKDCVEDNFAIA